MDDFLEQIGKLDFELLFALHSAQAEQRAEAAGREPVSQADIITLQATPEGVKGRRRAREAGETLLRQGKVAILIVAGGQGSRLGFSGPKGCFPASPIKKKPLFQLFAEQVRALSTRYGRAIPLLIMTSPENHSDTRAFFKDRAYFGLDASSVHLFSQAFLPSVTPAGDLILKDPIRLFVNPDGHGGSIKALHRSGLLSALLDGGYEELFYCQVDNPLVRIADPVFLGYHALAGAEASTKVVRRATIDEKVGVYVSRAGRDAIVEYIDMGPDLMSALDDRGEILYWAGSTAIHCFSLPFLRRLNDEGFALPYHCAAKEIEVMEPGGAKKKTTGWKFETFVFDAIPLAARTCCVEVERDAEFSPIKNGQGVDSPETAAKAMANLHGRWLLQAGVEVAEGTPVEISPLLSLDGEDLPDKLKGRSLTVSGPLYLE
jgi:UDP-N-acetylglucosamine/UDP-N-acetylgalactosamine diphosphorylase